MTHKKLLGTVISTLAVVLATSSLMPGVNAAPNTKQADTMTKPIATPSVTSTPGTMAQPTTPSTTKVITIVDLAVNSKKDFKTLTAALKAAGLVETLSGAGPFTLFAPNDAAFQKLPKGTLAKLLKPENKAALQQVLKNHVVSGTVLSKDIKAGNVTTLAGSNVAVKIVGKKVTLDKATVLRADVQATNGVVHIIDTVLVPANLKLK